MAIRRENRYERSSGNRLSAGAKNKTITFSWVKLDVNQGQTIEEWENEGHLSNLCNMMRQVGQYDSSQALAQQMIKLYTKVGFPPVSEFKEPKHVTPANWAVMHIKPSSKAVVAGYLEDDIFYIVFLDKEHKFWVTDIQSRGKIKR